MKPLVIALLVTVLVLAGAFILGRHLLRTTTNRWLGFVGIFLVGLPFSWTLFYGASSGGGAMLPIPDFIAIIALLTGEFHSGNYSAAGSIPPPFIMTAISSFVAYCICSKQRPDLFKSSR
jgi:hypothetical protein